MNVSMNWLKDFVNIDCDLKTFCDAMTMSGSKVEIYKNLGGEISNVVVGKILKIDKHPDADKLVVCKIDVGRSTSLQIVTGADNIKENDLIPVALDGSTLAGGVKINNGQLRGVDSEGMLCSIEELGFESTDFADAPLHGIYILNGDYKLGTDIKEILGLNDSMVEFEITSNRQDCYSIVGIAREAAATFDKTFTYNLKEIKGNSENANNYITIKIENPDLCRRYIGAVVKNIKIEPSPKWMQDRLRAVGLRPINNIVDITNYVMMEIGQPMHAFALDTVKDKKIIVKNATKGDKFVTLDGTVRTLDDTMLMICDGEKPVGIAGIMGGENSKINEDTKTILFESANFNGTNIRVNSKKLGMRTDASSKYEKDLDPNLTMDGLNRALSLIQELNAGEVVGEVIDIYPNKREEKTISYSIEKINNLLGTNLKEEEIIKLFERLEFKVDKSNKRLTIPTFRQDIDHDADLAEEVARLFGYEKIEPTNIISETTIGKLTETQNIIKIIKQVMESEGLSEIVTYSFESPKILDKLMIPENDKLRKTIKIINPLGEDFSVMRTQTLSGVLLALSNNYNKRNESAFVYEVGTTYIAKELPITELPNEVMNLTIGMYGDIDFYDIKGILEGLMKKLGVCEDYITSSDIVYMHPGKTANIVVNDKVIGYIGEVHPTLADNYEIEKKVYLACINVNELINNVKLNIRYKALPKYPSVSRDIALVLKDEIQVKQIQTIIKQNASELLESVELFDIYKGTQLGEGLKSVAYRAVFRSSDRTLTEEEVSTVMSKIIKELETKLDAKLR